jgi:hypothetical protein
MIGDVRKIKLNQRDDEGDVALRWWRAKTENDRALSIRAQAQVLQLEDSLRLRAAVLHTRLYQNSQVDSLYRYNVVRSSAAARPGEDSQTPGLSHRVSFNVVKSCIDTACAKISKNRPRVSFVTTGGDYEKQRRAKKLTQYADGLFSQCDLYAKTDDVFRDAAVYGTGAIKVSVDEKEGVIHAERALAFEFFTESTESIYGKPRTLYQMTPCNRDEIFALYGDTPEKRFAIESASGITEIGRGRAMTDMVLVCEAWHLPSGKDTGDGMHSITINGVELFNEEWSYDWFPVFFFHWCKPTIGMWGQGIAEELTGIQLEIAKLLRTIQRAQHLAAGFRVFVEKNADVNVSHLNNEIGEVVKFKGSPPIFDSVSRTVPPELYSHLENLVRKSYDLVGISQLSASAQKPSGLDAGVAIREMYDIESERFVKVGQRWEKYHVDIAGAMVQLTAALFERKPSLQITAPGTKFLETIKWSDVRLKEDEFEIRGFPTSSLPTTPAYRFQQITEWKKANIIDQEQMMQLLDMPDLERFTSLYTASINDIERVLSAIIERGEYQAPEPFMDLKRCVKMALSSLLKAREDGVSERRQELLLRWMDEAQSLIDASKPAPPAAPAAPSGPPMGAPPMPIDPNIPPPIGAEVAGLAPAIPPTSDIQALPTNVSAVPPPVAGMQ